MNNNLIANIIDSISDNLNKDSKEILSFQRKELNVIKKYEDLKIIYFTKKSFFNKFPKFKKEFYFSLLPEKLATFEIIQGNKKFLGEVFILQGALYWMSFNYIPSKIQIDKISIINVFDLKPATKKINKKEINKRYQNEMNIIEELSVNEAKLKYAELKKNNILKEYENKLNQEIIQMYDIQIIKNPNIGFVVNYEIDNEYGYKFIFDGPQKIFKNNKQNEVYEYSLSMGNNNDNFDENGHLGIHRSIYHYLLYLECSIRLTILANK